MATAHDVLRSAADRRALSSVRQALAPFAVQDWVVGAYCFVLFVGALSGRGEYRDVSIARMGGLLAFYVVAMLLVRKVLAAGTATAIFYRVAIYGSVQVSYFWLHDLLIACTTRSFDGALYELDISLFRIEPALWAERFVSTATTEWFAFFYFSYFVVLAAHVLPMLFLCKRKPLLAEFGLTMLTVYCTAQAMYLFLPAFGPHRAFADVFQNELPGGFWYRAVIAAVQSGGAERDAFPSLHTAGPTALALFSFRHRRELPFKYTWPVTAFFTVNIILATMFLRWHYVIDVVGGIALAAAALAMATVVTRIEAVHRAAAGLADAWPAYGRPPRAG